MDNDYNKMQIEYRYKGQLIPKSYVIRKSNEELIDWLTRYQNKTLEEYIQEDEIFDLISIYLINSTYPLVLTIMLIDNIYYNFLRVKDRTLITFEDLDDIILFLKIFNKDNKDG